MQPIHKITQPVSMNACEDMLFCFSFQTCVWAGVAAQVQASLPLNKLDKLFLLNRFCIAQIMCKSMQEKEMGHHSIFSLFSEFLDLLLLENTQVAL